MAGKSSLVNVLIVGLENGCVNVVKDRATSNVSAILNELLIKGIDLSGYHFTYNGNPVDKESGVSIEVSDSEQESGVVVLRAYPRVQGGKGGFGALIRAMGMQINKSRSRDACRDLDGRRMRDVNAEKKLAEWAKAQPEKERKKAQEKARKREMLLSGGPKHFFNDTEYMQQLEATEGNMDSALRQGLQVASSNSRGKRKASTVMDAHPSKKSKAWPVLEDDLDTDSDDQEDMEDKCQRGDQPSSSLGSGVISERSERDAKLPSSLDSATDLVHSGDQDPQTTDQQSHTDSPTRKAPTDHENIHQNLKTNSQYMPRGGSLTSHQDRETNFQCTRQPFSQTGDRELKANAVSGKQEDHEVDLQVSSMQDSSEKTVLVLSGKCNDMEEDPHARDNPMKPPLPGRTKTIANTAQEEDGQLSTSCERKEEQDGQDSKNKPSASLEVQPLNLELFGSSDELEAQGAELLKLTLQHLGLKCGGTVTERAQRLFSVKGKSKDEIDRSLFAKPKRGRGKEKRK